MNIIRKMFVFGVAIEILILAGCAHVPKDAPELSAELGRQISAMETSHLALLHRFFDMKRAEVNDFISKEYLPTFAENFFKQKSISGAWNTIVSENNSYDRLKFITTVGVKLQEEINKQQVALLEPVNSLEQALEKAIEDEYNQARAVNQSLTSFLYSAAEVSENRQRYLDMVGATDAKIDAAVGKVDELVSSALDAARKAEDKAPDVEKYLKKVEDLKKELATK